jgi:hypothetical protein
MLKRYASSPSSYNMVTSFRSGMDLLQQLSLKYLVTYTIRQSQTIAVFMLKDPTWCRNLAHKLLLPMKSCGSASFGSLSDVIVALIDAILHGEIATSFRLINFWILISNPRFCHSQIKWDESSVDSAQHTCFCSLALD